MMQWRLICGITIIKKKLDNVISNQRKDIFNQAIIISQNQELIDQNTEMLDQLAEIHQSIEESNQYAQISAENINECRWLAELATWDRIYRN